MTHTETILVTGAHGFTGRYLCDALRNRGYHVVGASYQASSDPNIYSCDISNPKSIEQAVLDIKPDRVAHLAAVSFVGANDANAFYQVNVIGTCNLLNALEKVQPRQILIASSANIYGQPADGKPIAENHLPAPINHYAASKLAMEHMVKTFQQRLPIVITRPFNYSGPGQDERFLVPKIVAHFARKASVIALGNLDVSRDFTGINDVVAAYIGLLETNINDRIFNVCSGKAISLQQILQWLEEISGHSLEVKVNPALVRNNEIRTLVGDHRSLSKSIGWQPKQNFKDVLADMLDKQRTDTP